MTTQHDPDRFPAPVYAETVLAPLFEQSIAHFAEAMASINRAHLVMLAETGILSASDAGAILAALADHESETDPHALRYDGSVEDYYFHVEQDLIRRLGVDLAGKMHTGRSRNDMGHAMFRMVLKVKLEALISNLHGCIEALLAKAEDKKNTIWLAYTHGQPAQPTSFGHYLGAFVEVLLRHGERLRLAHYHLDHSPMGAAAITTSGFPINRVRMAELLGFGAVQENSYGCIAATDDVAAVYGAMKLLFVDLGRFAQDLTHWTAFETGLLRAPRSYVQISSIMPQKRNPVVTEHLRLLASLAAGQCDGVVDSFRNTPFMDINDSESETHVAGYEAIKRGRRALTLLADVIGVFEVNEIRARDLIAESCATVTEVADGLVRADGLSFRQAHDIAAGLAKAAIAECLKLEDVPFERFAEIFEKSIGRPPRTDASQLKTLASPEHFIAVRDRLGGPAEASLTASLTRYRHALESLQANLAAKSTDRRQAAEDLDREVDALLREQAA